MLFDGETQLWDSAAVQPFFSLYRYLGEAEKIVAIETSLWTGRVGSLAWQLASSDGEAFSIEDLGCQTLEELVLKAGILGCLA